SVCSSPEKLPVHPKKRGRARTTAGAVVTSTGAGWAAVFVSSFLTLAFEPPHEIAKSSRPAKAAARTKSCNDLEDDINSISFLENRFPIPYFHLSFSEAIHLLWKSRLRECR